METGGLGFVIELSPYDMGQASVPTLHSSAAGEYNGMWIILGGRTNGLHGFENFGEANFPKTSAPGCRPIRLRPRRGDA